MTKKQIDSVLLTFAKYLGSSWKLLLFLCVVFFTVPHWYMQSISKVNKKKP